MQWKIVADNELHYYFGGENVWSKRWEKIADERANVIGHQGQSINLTVWEAPFNDGRKKFAADEMSNNVWIFAVPQL